MREFITRAMQVTLEDRCARHDALKERLANDASYPAFWRKAVDRYLNAFHDSAGRPEFYLPVEFRGQGSLETGFVRLRECVGEFANLLEYWPAILAEIRR